MAFLALAWRFFEKKKSPAKGQFAPAFPGLSK
jgi:hypothetical protein